MKRFHVHVSVTDLDQSIGFYSKLFGAVPAVVKPDYAKWMLEDPRLNFAISQRGHAPGINHLGLQTDSDEELDVLHAQLQQADVAAHQEKDVGCCYALSNKYWVTDPTGIAWETFHTLGSVPTFDGTDASRSDAACSAEAGSTAVRSIIPLKSASPCCS